MCKYHAVTSIAPGLIIKDLSCWSYKHWQKINVIKNNLNEAKPKKILNRDTRTII